MIIVSRAPCRISVAGGGTDVDPFAFRHGGQVLNIAITLHHTATLVPRPGSDAVALVAMGEIRSLAWTGEKLAYGDDREFDLLRATLNHFSEKIPSGFSLEIASPSVNPIGLGRSGSVAVATIGAFDAWLGTGMTRMEIGLLGSRLEIEELGWLGGKQDPLASVHGGLNHFFFGPGQDVRVEPVAVTEEALNALRARTFMIAVGGERHSSEQQKRLVAGFSDAEKLAALKRMALAVPAARSALQREDWRDLGGMLHETWEEKKRSNPTATNEVIDEAYALVRRCGAYGGKVSGAGGGGSMLVFIPPENREAAIQACASAGFPPIDFDVDPAGLTVRTV